LPQPYTLNDVVCWFLAARGRREEAYVRLRSISRMQFRAAAGAAAARGDYRLRPFRLHDLRFAARERHQSGALRRNASTDVLSYAPNRVADLPTERESSAAAGGLSLVWPLSASPTYVISDEDLLEFICALQSEHLAPEKLFHELEHNHLLFIGSNFTNWLARLFLRMAKRQRLSDPRDVGEVMADNTTSQDERLVSFLQQVSVRTRIYVGAERFVEELHQRAGGAPQARNPSAGRRRSAALRCRRRATCPTTRCS
jgi:hypothetical protein